MNRLLSATVVSYLVVSMAEGSLALAQAPVPPVPPAPGARPAVRRAGPLGALRAAPGPAVAPAPAPAIKAAGPCQAGRSRRRRGPRRDPGRKGIQFLQEAAAGQAHRPSQSQARHRGDGSHRMDLQHHLRAVHRFGSPSGQENHHRFAPAHHARGGVPLVLLGPGFARADGRAHGQIPARGRERQGALHAATHCWAQPASARGSPLCHQAGALDVSRCARSDQQRPQPYQDRDRRHHRLPQLSSSSPTSRKASTAWSRSSGNSMLPWARATRYGSFG